MYASKKQNQPQRNKKTNLTKQIAIDINLK